MQYLTSIDLSKNQLKNAVIHNVLSTDEIISPYVGQVCFHTVDKKLYICTQAIPTVIWTAVAENAFSNVVVSGQPTISADGIHDTLTVVAGSNINITTNADTDALTINSSYIDTLYNVTTEPGADMYSEKIRLHGTDSTVDDIIIAVGSTNGLYGLTIDEEGDTITLAHANTSSQASVDNPARTYIQDITLDTFGHITSISSGSETVVDTDTTYTHKVSTQTGGAGIDLDAGGSGSGTDTIIITGTDGTTVSRVDENSINITSHVQNTDSGTNNASFTIDLDNANAEVDTSIIFNRGTSAIGDAAIVWRVDALDASKSRFELMADSTELASLRINNLTVEGELTAISSNEVNIGDSMILLNADITTSAENSDGGIAVKRLASDNITRKDAEVNYDTSTNRWETTFGAISGNLVTAPIANKIVAQVGDGNNTVYVLTHNLNTRDLNVLIRETNSPYAMVMTDIEFSGVNDITVKFAVAPTLNQYTVTIIG